MHFHPRLAMPLAAALLLGLTPLAASAKTLHISGNFVTENSATTTPTGNITGTLDTTTGVLDYTVTYGGLTGPVLAAHFHGPAAPGQEAPVMLDPRPV
jgi:hypothetical protein